MMHLSIAATSADFSSVHTHYIWQHSDIWRAEMLGTWSKPENKSSMVTRVYWGKCAVIVSAELHWCSWMAHWSIAQPSPALQGAQMKSSSTPADKPVELFVVQMTRIWASGWIGSASPSSCTCLPLTLDVHRREYQEHYTWWCTWKLYNTNPESLKAFAGYMHCWIGAKVSERQWIRFLNLLQWE